jgi:hypothetical protein
MYDIGGCSEHPHIHCLNASVRPNETWHIELTAQRLLIWANAIVSLLLVFSTFVGMY